MAEKIYNLENCTNKEFLVRRHDDWLNRIRPIFATDTPAQQLLAESWTERPKCKVGDIHSLNRVNVSTLKLSVNKILSGKYFLCRNICSPYISSGFESVVEEPEGGDNAFRLVVPNYMRPGNPRDLTHAMPIGALLVILNPFFTGKEPGGYILRVDNSEHLLFMEEQVFQAIFPNLKEKGSKLENSESAVGKSNQIDNAGGFNAGDIIQGKCDPFVKVFLDPCKGKICHNCCQEGKLLRCSRCHLRFYCNRTCQSKDWKDSHSLECKSEYFRKTAISDALPSDNFSLQLFRLFVMLKLNPERGKNKVRLYDGNERSFDDLLLLCRQSELKKVVWLREVCEAMVKELAEEKFCVNNDETVDHLHSLAVVWRRYAHSILDEAGTSKIGSSLYIESSAFEHSCRPNAVLFLQGGKMEIRAITSIPKGTKPSVRYFGGNESKKSRAALLMNKMNLICECERCILEEKENLVDYDKLQNLIEDAEKQSDWEIYLAVHEKILLMLRKLYHEYDPRITNRCFLAYQTAKKLDAPMTITLNLGETAKEHLMITFGAESSEVADYEKLAQKIYNLENCTNKEFVIREYDDRLNLIRPLLARFAENTTFEQRLQEIVTVRPKCKVGDIHPSNRVNISALKLSVNKILHGKYFLCRTIAPPFMSTFIETVVEDPEGDHAVRLVQRNYLPANPPREAGHIMLIGTLLVILNPFLSGSEPNGYGLLVSDPAQVLDMEEQAFQTIFPDLKWKGSNKKQSIVKIPSIENNKGENSEAVAGQSNPEVNARGFNAGDIIQGKCDPFVKILSEQYKGKLCHNCFEEGELLRCTRCQLKFYCNKTCQSKDWKDGHSMECKSQYSMIAALADAFTEDSEFSQLFRLFAMLKLKPERGKNKVLLYDGSERSFDDLLLRCTQSQLKNDAGLREMCESMVNSLAEEKFCDNNEDAVDHLLRLAYVWKRNSYPVLDKSGTSTIGKILFIESSAIEHSCRPNALLRLQGRKLEIRAIASIPKGTKACRSYIDVNKPKEERAAFLLLSYSFICKCELCILEEKGNLVDYDKLQNLIEDAETQKDSKLDLVTHAEILRMLRKLYHEYDQRITDRYYFAFQVARKLRASKEIILHLAELAKEHVKITYGTECRQYQTCENPYTVTMEELVERIMR